MIRYLYAGLLSVALCGAVCAEEEQLEGEPLAQKSNCMACHKVEARVVGPSYKDVSKKYLTQIREAEDQAAEEASVKDYLFSKVKKGGAGVWGQVPMPANVHVKDEDITRLVDWVLSLAAEKP